MDSPFDTTTQGIIKASALLPEPGQLEVPHAASWVAYHQAYPEVYAEFCRLAEQMRLERQRAFYSIEIIINVMRWHRDLGPLHGHEQFKINNNFKAFYGRAYEYHYAADSFFKRRKSYADELIFPPAHYGILRGRLPSPE